jgi:hypothetical protein
VARHARHALPKTPDVPTVPEQEGAMIRVCRGVRLNPAAYRFYRDVLLTFVEGGGPPDAARLRLFAERRGVPLEATLARLAVADLVQRDPATGAIAAAYPFSGVHTPHRITLDIDPGAGADDEAGGAEVATHVFAMCALDALGIPLMLGRTGRIASRDALTGEPVTVTLRLDADALAAEARPIPLAAWRASWHPDEAVLLARPAEHEAEHDAGLCTASGTCCPVTNFFSSRRHAEEWMAEHPSSDARPVQPDEALRRAYELFAGVLDRELAEKGGGDHAEDD